MIRWVPLSISAVTVAVVVLTAAQDEKLPEGKGKEVLERMCTNCHGLEQVTSNRYAKKVWGSVVDEMVSKGAEGSEEDASLVIGYLARNFGKPVNINKATAKELETDLSFTPAASDAVVKYRTDNGAFKSFEELQKVPGLNAGLLDEQKKNITF